MDNGAQYALVAANAGDMYQRVPFWFPIAGSYVEELHGGDLNLKAIPAFRRSRWQSPHIAVASGPQPGRESSAACDYLEADGAAGVD